MPIGDDVVVAGNFRGTVDFGKGPLTGQDASYVAHLDTNGVTQWVTLIASPMAQTVIGAAPANDGGVFVFGSCYESITVAGQTFPCAANGSGTPTGGMLLHLGPDGALVWVRTYAGSNYAQIGSVASDAAGAAYVVGSGSGIDFGGGAVPDKAAVAKIGPDGTVVWSHGFSSIGLDLVTPTTIRALVDGRILLAGARANTGPTLTLTLHYYGHLLSQTAGQPLSPKETTRRLQPDSTLLRLHDDSYYSNLIV